MAKLRGILKDNKLVALGEYADDISIPIPETIGFNNFNRMLLVDAKSCEKPESWTEIQKTEQEKEQEASEILYNAIKMISSITGKDQKGIDKFINDQLKTKK